MLISLKHRFVFLCTPKCASNSIEAMLKPHAEIHLLGSPQVRHTNVRQFERHLRPYLDEVTSENDFELVAVIREPVAWLHSWYRFRARKSLRGGSNKNSTAHLSFSEFVTAFLSTDSRPEFANVGSQLDFLHDANGSVGVDRLYAYDNLADLEAYFSKLVGAQLSMRAINVSPTRVYRSNIIEAVASLSRRLRSRFAVGRASPVKAGADPRAELAEDLRARLDRHFAEESKIYLKALQSDVVKEHCDQNHRRSDDL